MKKKLGLLMLGIALAGSLTACSSGGNSGSNGTNGGNAPGGEATETPKDDKPAEKTKITYWTGDRHDADYIKEKIAAFNETNEDNIEVEMVVKTEEYDQALDIAFVGAQAPDVFRVKENTIQTYYKKGYLEPIDAYLTEDMTTKFPRIDNFSSFEGKTYSLPNYGSTMRLVYNIDLFEKAGIAEPPKTLAEMVEAARKITEVGKADGAYGFALNFKSPGSAFGRSARVIAEMSGYGGFGYDFKTGRFDFNGFKDIIGAFKQMKDDGSMLPGSESLDIDPLRAQFAEGKIGMYLSFSSEPGVYKNQFPAKIRWAGALPPTIDGNVKGVAGFLGGQWMVMSNQSKNKEAAWKFMAFMYSDEVLKGYAEGGFGIPMVPHIAETAAKPQIEGIDGFFPTKYDGVWPLTPTVTPEGATNWDEFWRYVNEGGDFDKLAEDLNNRYNAALDKAIASGEVTAQPDPSFDPASMQGAFASE
ncbi:ABC transporter substrate-binding protein [Paenibacillus soyae]|uniref:Sugar ABC transporter substrate-binding protein n=1 Tax=Paenibacillus soyae TaxID=2969249 RepID=A0A9X2MSQ3_9BACL|nr:sugar ABC transporter substrate-binding protein [Paenibacillus soyae]MCR2805735.1 sugar ABC transporter substrate-binding protein [Paenibacillus soyae]